jgi:hypothetical protein
MSSIFYALMIILFAYVLVHAGDEGNGNE